MWRDTMGQTLPLFPLNRYQALSLAALVALGGLVAVAPMMPLLLTVGVGAALLFLVRWPWLIWPAIGVVLPVASGLRMGLLSLTDLLLAVAIVLWFADGVRRRQLRLEPSPVVGWVAAYVGILILAALAAVDLREAAVEVVKWVQVALLLVLVQGMMPSNRGQWLVAALLLGAMVQALIGLYQFVNRIGPEWFVILDRFMRASGTFSQPNPYAGYLGLTLPVAVSLTLWGWRRWLRDGFRPGWLAGWTLFYTAATLLISAGLVASWSRGGWLGATAGVLVVLIFRSRAAILAGGVALLFLFAATLLGVLTPALVPAAVSDRLAGAPAYLGLTDVLNQPVTDENFAVVERVAHWVAAIRMWELSPWLGVGPGNYEAVYPAVRLPQWEEALGHAHNIYLNVLGESGLVGLAFFLALWVAVLVWVSRRIIEWRRQGVDWQAALAVGVLGVLVHLSVHNFFDNLFVQGMQLHVALWLALINLTRSPSEG
jgi:putative inorganic carbon (hco3(-)) transporter